VFPLFRGNYGCEPRKGWVRVGLRGPSNLEVHMSRLGLPIVAGTGVVLCAVGAILAFTLKSDPAWGEVELDALGLVTLVLGAVLLSATALAFVGVAPGRPATNGNNTSGSGSSSEGPIRALGSLLGVVVAITAVTVIGLVTITKFAGTDADKDSIVAIATSAFGVVSAIVAAFLGIKVTADQGAQIVSAKEDQVKTAQEDAQAAQNAVAAVEQVAKSIDDPKAQQKIDDAIKAGSKVAEKTSPRSRERQR
jgi:hypothetical protein